jgi:hypothetical protein
MASPTNAVLFIGGEGRSGSTLLSALIGQHQGFFSVGELHGIWQAVRTNELCSCGNAFRDCGFWSAVGTEAYGGWDEIDLPKMLWLDRYFTRHRHAYRVIAPSLPTPHRTALAEYVRVLASLYRAIRATSTCDVIVDSSKDPPYAFLLRHCKELDIRLVQLVRDSRGVAYSWGKRDVQRPEYVHHPTLAGTFMKTRPPWRAAVEWVSKNLLLEFMGKTGTPRMLVRYESLTSAPELTVHSILAYAAQPLGRSTLVGERRDSTEPQHMLGGNRIRFKRDVGPIRPDDDWRMAMPRGRRVLVTALSAPLLIRYGYLGPQKFVAGGSAT